MSTKSNIDENIEILDFKYQLNNPKKDNSLLKNFILIREKPSNHEYVTPGVVAVGSIFQPSGKVVIQWLQTINSINIYDNIEDLQKITCSHSQSRIEYI